jgi:hypothetical protein
MVFLERNIYTGRDELSMKEKRHERKKAEKKNLLCLSCLKII